MTPLLVRLGRTRKRLPKTKARRSEDCLKKLIIPLGLGCGREAPSALFRLTKPVPIPRKKRFGSGSSVVSEEIDGG